MEGKIVMLIVCIWSFVLLNCIYVSPVLAARDVTGVQMEASVPGRLELLIMF
jgi:hypothetical protein